MPGPKPPIFHVPEEERLFTTPDDTTGDCFLLHAVQCFSFYNFVHVKDPKAAADAFSRSLLAEGIRPYEQFAGTVYFAHEGVNGQFSVRAGAMQAFKQLLASVTAALVPGSCVDLNIGDLLPEGTLAPFKRFHVTARNQILTDGLLPPGSSCAPYDWTDAGPELSPSQWHAQLLAAKSSRRASNEGVTAQPAPSPLLLDCRNVYETEVGTFEGANPLGTTKFADSWSALDKAVEELPKDTPVYTFCTGGIRCVKVNAYLKQKHQLQSLSRLQHGIIGYERWVAGHAAADTDCTGPDDQPTVESLFQGDNFIFDTRHKFKKADDATERASKKSRSAAAEDDKTEDGAAAEETLAGVTNGERAV